VHRIGIPSDDIIRRAAKYGIGVVRPLELSDRRAVACAPVAEKLSERLFELPNTSTMSENETRGLAHAFISALQ